MKYDIKDFSWVNEPKIHSVEQDRITITTEPETDLWQRTFYNGQADNGHMLLMKTDEKRFTFGAKAVMKGELGAYDQCGLAIYLDSDNWLKASCEYENEETQHLGSVLTTHGYSDWATNDIPADIKEVWYRISRKDDDYVLERSFDGEAYSILRMFHMFEGGAEIRIGFYACSPDESSFTAEFTDIEISEFDENAL